MESIGSPYFEIVGEDYRSVAFVHELSEHIAGRCASYLDLPAGYPQRVLVSLLPGDGAAAVDRPYRISVQDRGFVTLYLRWDKSLQLEELCFALTDALLCRQAIFNAGAGADRAVRHWTVAALSGETYLSLRPAQRQSFLDTLETDLDGGGISAVLSGGRHVPESLSDLRAGYWVVEALRESGWSHTDIRDALRAGLRGVDVAEGIVLRMGADAENDDGFDLDRWWSGFREMRIRQGQPWFDGLAESREWIGAFARFEFPADADRSGGHLRTLWRYRADAELRATVEARLRLLRLRMDRVNPAYHNAAQSLGVLFETVLNSDEERLFVAALARYLGDYEDACRMEAEIMDALEAGER